MKILIIGNISTGKSTLLNFLANKYPDFDTLLIDDFRKKNSDGTILGEENCKKKFLSHINENTNQIIEISGIGQLGESVCNNIKSHRDILIIYIRCSLYIINERNKHRNWDIPFPCDIDNIPVAVNFTENEYNAGLLHKILNNLPNSTLYSFSNENKREYKQACKDISNIIDSRKTI